MGMQTHVLVADGAMGTTLFQMGLAAGESAELWNVDHPEKIRAVHRQYIEAGSQLILTNSFGGNRLRLDELADRIEELNKAAAQCARLEADAAPHKVIVAGSMGPSGTLLEPLGTLTYDEAVQLFAEQAAALVAGGVDWLWIETMSDLNEVKAAIAGCRQAAPETPLAVTMTFDTNGRTMMGITPEQAAATLSELGIQVFGANCGNGTADFPAIMAKMHAAAPTATLIAKANAGMPTLTETDQVIYDATPESMGDYAQQVYASGARIIGACCGSTPLHIKSIYNQLREVENMG